MSSDKKSKEDSKKKINNEIEIENKDLLNVFFDNSGNQFESNFYLSRKRVLNAENGQNELSDLLKSKLKALDMMLLILTNNKNILNESELSCCEVLNNLLSLSKKDKVYGEQIYSKIKTIMIYFIKNKIALKEKNIEDNRVIIKFVITLFNIKFDNNYFKQILDLISVEENILDIFIHELFNKLFKGRNITIKIKEMKYIIKSILTNDKIIKYKNYFDIMELILSYAKEKNNGGCRTGFQLNQVVFLLQYMLDIININEIKKNLPDKKSSKTQLLKIVEMFYDSINDLINKEDYEFDKNINKKNLDIKNDNIKRKKIFFGEMLNFLNKLKKNFDVLKEKEFSDKLEEINKLYKNIINVKYVIVVNNNNNNTNKKNKEKIKEEIVKNESEDENMKEDNNEEKEEEDKNEDKNEIIEENKDEKLDKKEDKENEEGMNLEEEQEEEPKNQKVKGKDKKQKKDKQKKAQEEKDKEKKENKENKDNEENKEMLNKKSKRKESKEKDDNKKENKNKKKKK